MPRKNIVKQYVADQTYHIYSRGVAKQVIFFDEQDFGYFIGLFKRYLSIIKTQNNARIFYPNYHESLELNAFCIMPNHFHLLIHQRDAKAITEFMKSLVTSYSMYFNKRHKRTGPVFESSFKASLISTDAYALHISRYIHLNPKKWRTYDYSSIQYYSGDKSSDWLSTKRALSGFEDIKEYFDFIADYENYKESIDEVRWELADQ